MSDYWIGCRFKASDAERAAIHAQCDNAEEELKEFERRDIKHKEDRKHCKAKLKKAEEKLAKDASKLQVRSPFLPPSMNMICDTVGLMPEACDGNIWFLSSFSNLQLE